MKSFRVSAKGKVRLLPASAADSDKASRISKRVDRQKTDISE